MEFTDFVEPIDVHDILIDGIARIEPLGGGMVRVWLYAEEGLSAPMRVIRSRLVLPLDKALEINSEARAVLTRLIRIGQPLALVR